MPYITCTRNDRVRWLCQVRFRRFLFNLKNKTFHFFGKIQILELTRKYFAWRRERERTFFLPISSAYIELNCIKLYTTWRAAMMKQRDRRRRNFVTIHDDELRFSIEVNLFLLSKPTERYGRLRFNVAIHVASPVIKIIQLVIFSSSFFSFSLPLSCFLFDFSETRKWTSIWRISAGPAEMPHNMYKRGRTITDVPTRPSLLCFLLSFVFLLREREKNKNAGLF